jgi:hypothetical protein
MASVFDGGACDLCAGDSVRVFGVQRQTARLGGVNTTGKTTPFHMMLGFQPDKVSLNDNSEILAEIK